MPWDFKDMSSQRNDMPYYCLSHVPWYTAPPISEGWIFLQLSRICSRIIFWRKLRQRWFPADTSSLMASDSSWTGDLRIVPSRNIGLSPAASVLPAQISLCHFPAASSWCPCSGYQMVFFNPCFGHPVILCLCPLFKERMSIAMSSFWIPLPRSAPSLLIFFTEEYWKVTPGRICSILQAGLCFVLVFYLSYWRDMLPKTV